MRIRKKSTLIFFNPTPIWKMAMREAGQYKETLREQTPPTILFSQLHLMKKTGDSMKTF